MPFFNSPLKLCSKRSAGLAVVLLLMIVYPCFSEELLVSHLATEGISGWEKKSFKGTTAYKIVQDEGRAVIKAESNASASGLIKKIQFDPRKFRYLKWSWKIEHPVSKGDEKTKAGDDFAARLYVVFPGTMFWQTKAINYVWANKLGKGESFPNPHTKNAMMLVMQSGESHAGEWISEQRDILADFQKLFGTVPTEGIAIAIMTDTDNTGGNATAWYGEIKLSSEP